MLQLKLKADVHDSELLRRHIELAAEDIAAEIRRALLGAPLCWQVA